MKRLLLFLIIFTLVSFPLVSLAQTNVGLQNPLCPDSDPACARGSSIPALIESILSWLKDIASVIAGGMVVFGAFQMLLAGDDPEKFSMGKKTILYAVVGYVIIWVGWGITSIIKGVLTTSP